MKLFAKSDKHSAMSGVVGRSALKHKNVSVKNVIEIAEREKENKVEIEKKEYKTEKEMIFEVINSGKAHDIKEEDLIMEQQIGSGHFGTVYKAIWNGNTVAVKHLTRCTENSTDINDETQRKEMESEIILASSIPIHNNLVQIFGYISCPFGVVMSFMCGDSVQKYVYRSYKKENDPIPTIPELLIILRKTSSGLKFLHKYGLIHRDIACRNILLGEIKNNHIDKLTQVKISDFGLTRQLQYNDTEQQTKSNIGPLKWMAPESIKEKEYSKKSDVYMFGITMWEIFYGMEPYIDMSAVNAAISVVTNGKRPQIIHEMPHRYQDLMQKCWHQKPNKRPNFDEILTQLDQFEANPIK